MKIDSSLGKPPRPPDAAQRELIQTALDQTILVEAAAGTGKTTSLIARMVALLAQGRCQEIDRLVAVTFTRRAASELRFRFQAALELAGAEAEGEAAGRLRQAAGRVERCFIGTIHSFCARLLRERPVEAGVDVAFEEMDEAADYEIRDQAWEEYLAQEGGQSSAHRAELAGLGLAPTQLKEAFLKLCDYPDVTFQPARPATPLKTAAARQALEEYASHMESLWPGLPRQHGNDWLISRYEIIPRMLRQADLDDEARLMEIMGLFGQARTVQGRWPNGRPQAIAEQERFNQFHQTYARPLQANWLERRYEPCLRAIQPALAIYDRLRRDEGRVSFQDLLFLTAAMLRNNPQVRRYFQRRFSHLLVDEFQDTDPLQAEVILLLAASDPAETDWRACEPQAGALFLVGDPKQAIYRFRRADIVTYNQVKAIIEKSGGLVVNLQTNFRTDAPVVDWINRVFENIFPAQADDYSPAHVPLEVGREGRKEGAGVSLLALPKGLRGAALAEYEGRIIARSVGQALADQESGLKPSDFMILTRYKKNLALYASHLKALGIPHLIHGGAALSQLKELALLRDCLAALARPDDPVALVAVLRGQLFGLSDQALYDFKRRGGEFNYLAAPPAPPQTEEEQAALIEAVNRLRTYAGWLASLPPLAATERIAADLGLIALAAAGPGGDVQAGSLLKALEILRARRASAISPAELAAELDRLVAGEEAFDGMTALGAEPSAVRVMNLHQAKGLEAAMVFLADPTGKARRQPKMHIDRSASPARGRLAIQTPWGKNHWQTLALPPDWERAAAIEERFQEAEEARLLYVACTRAGQRLCVTQRATYQNENPWAFLEPYLEGSPSLEEPELKETRSRPTLRITAAEAAQAKTEIRGRL
ncbi:MAG: UvrD-helicase domain-containing protein, partial [Deltaproteobacteria bacterium]|nr:UvrD-helicase domain-containing protein [Deltaproteobacteria bacterium]